MVSRGDKLSRREVASMPSSSDANRSRKDWLELAAMARRWRHYACLETTESGGLKLPASMIASPARPNHQGWPRNRPKDTDMRRSTRSSLIDKPRARCREVTLAMSSCHMPVKAHPRAKLVSQDSSGDVAGGAVEDVYRALRRASREAAPGKLVLQRAPLSLISITGLQPRQLPSDQNVRVSNRGRHSRP